MIIFTDLHLKEDSEDTVFDEVLPGIQKACLDHQDFTAACLGDVFHFRYRVLVRLFNRLRDTFWSWAEDGIEIILLPGNHDQINVAGQNVLEALDDLPNVSVYNRPTFDEWGLWLPYRKNPQDLIRFLNSPHPESGDAVFYHGGVQGAWMNENIADTNGLPPDAFRDWSTVICGHYHKRQTLSPNGVHGIHYVGSPYQTRADEAGQEKGYATWDGKTLTMMTTKWGKRYHKLRLEAGDHIPLDQYNTGDELRIDAALGVDIETIGSLLHTQGIDHVITKDNEKPETRLDVEDGASLEEYARAYAHAQPSELDPDKLMSTFNVLTTVGQP